MKHIGIVILLCFSFYGMGYAQDFNAYNKITNQDFKKFTELFEKKELPIDSDYLLEEYTFYDMNYSGVPQEFRKFLMRNGKLIPGELYAIDDESSPDGLAAMEGYFHSLYKLPTNGDYVILVIAQTSEIEYYSKVYAYSFDLEGNFIYNVITLYSPLSEKVISSIDENLYTHDIYPLYDRSDPDKLPGNEAYVAQKAHLIREIKSNGKAVFKSIEKTDGVKFKYDEETKLNKIIE